uniref:EGF-like domain-containing protein n=1 Tax=Ascaris lumbricoides TaxID=6252 RepID=A0A0M3HGG8_ASCLU
MQNNRKYIAYRSRGNFLLHLFEAISLPYHLKGGNNIPQKAFIIVEIYSRTFKGLTTCVMGICVEDENFIRGFSCECLEGYEGLNCDLIVRPDFIGYIQVIQYELKIAEKERLEVDSLLKIYHIF